MNKNFSNLYELDEVHQPNDGSIKLFWSVSVFIYQIHGSAFQETAIFSVY